MAFRPSAMTAMRSLSFTRNSSAPVTMVSPCAQDAATNSTGNSSMARGTRCFGHMNAFQLRRTHFDIGHRLSAGGAMIHHAQVRAHQRAGYPATPVRVGLMPTPVMVSTASFLGLIEPATMKKADGRKIPRHFQGARFQLRRRRRATLRRARRRPGSRSSATCARYDRA